MIMFFQKIYGFIYKYKWSYRVFELQLVKYNISNENNNFIKYSEPRSQLEDSWLMSLAYKLERENYNYSCFIIYQNYKQGNYNKFSFGNRISLKPIAFDLIINTYQIITVGTKINLTKNLYTNLYYNFGDFYASPVYDNKGYISMALKYDF